MPTCAPFRWDMAIYLIYKVGFGLWERIRPEEMSLSHRRHAAEESTQRTLTALSSGYGKGRRSAGGWVLFRIKRKVRLLASISVRCTIMVLRPSKKGIKPMK